MLDDLLIAYSRRKRFEAQLIAQEVGLMLVGPQRAQRQRTSQRQRTQTPEPGHVSADELMTMMGASF